MLLIAPPSRKRVLLVPPSSPPTAGPRAPPPRKHVPRSRRPAAGPPLRLQRQGRPQDQLLPSRGPCTHELFWPCDALSAARLCVPVGWLLLICSRHWMFCFCCVHRVKTYGSVHTHPMFCRSADVAPHLLHRHGRRAVRRVPGALHPELPRHPVRGPLWIVCFILCAFLLALLWPAVVVHASLFSRAALR